MARIAALATLETVTPSTALALSLLASAEDSRFGRRYQMAKPPDAAAKRMNSSTSAGAIADRVVQHCAKADELVMS